MNHLHPDRVIVSLTSIKSREKSLKETIESLVKQDLGQPYEVRINLSHDPYLLDEGFERAPEWIDDFRGTNPYCTLRIDFVKNSGPYRKLLPVLIECQAERSDPIIVTCDDDTHYSPDWLSTLLKHHYQVRGIVAYRGHTIALAPDMTGLAPYSKWQRNPKKLRFSLLNLPTGKDGILYRASYFDPAVADIGAAMKIAPTADDLWFKWHTLICGVPCYLISLNKKILPNTASFDESVSLWETFNKCGKNDETINALEKHLLDQKGYHAHSVLTRYANCMERVDDLIAPAWDDPIYRAARQVHVVSAAIDDGIDPSLFSLSYELFRKSCQYRNQHSTPHHSISPRNTPTAAESRRIAVAIPTFNRKDALIRLLHQLDTAAKGFDVVVTIFDDGSKEPVEKHLPTLQYIQQIHTQRFSNHGKKRYWALVNTIFSTLQEINADHFFYLADDLEVDEDFFSNSLSTWDQIPDPTKISLNLLRDHRLECWTRFQRTERHFNELTVFQTQWLDMVMMFDRKLLTYRVHEIPLSRWEWNPLRSSGVGEQLSIRLHHSGYNMYQVTSSLVYHGDHESQMNPEERKKNPLLSHF